MDKPLKISFWDRDLRSNLEAKLRPTSGCCVMVDIVDSTKLKQKPPKAWIVDLMATFVFLEYRFAAPRLKIVGDMMMFWANAAADVSCSHVFEDAREALALVRAQAATLRPVRMAAVWCEEIYEITFEDTKDVYGSGIDLTARLLALAGEGEIIMNKGFHDRIGNVPEIEGPWTFHLKGFPSVQAFKYRHHGPG
jgi:class 3 adenylate cyclase